MRNSSQLTKGTVIEAAEGGLFWGGIAFSWAYSEPVGKRRVQMICSENN